MAMDAFTAIPILERKLAELEAKEPSWRNCRACPFSGKCCDGALLIVFPEEKAVIADYLRRNPGVLEYALTRFKRKETCYFYDQASSRCRIHEVRPLNCRWTPHTAFSDGKGSLTLQVRDGQCNFTPMTVPSSNVDGTTISIDARYVKPGSNRTYLSWPDIAELHALRQRSHEMEELEILMSALAR